MQIQKVFQAGNSEVVAIPKSILKELGLKKGQSVSIELAPNNTIVISKTTKSKKKTSLTPEFLSWLEGFNKEYGPALKELAKK